jgi:hypothetical protein
MGSVPGADCPLSEKSKTGRHRNLPSGPSSAPDVEGLCIVYEREEEVMTYGRSCSKNSVSNNRLYKSTGDRRGRNLRSLGASGGALVPRVPRDTHLDGLCRRRFELAEKFVINLTCGPGRVASRFRKIRARTGVLEFAISNVDLGASGRAIRTWIWLTFAGRWSSGCAKAGCWCVIDFGKCG